MASPWAFPCTRRAEDVAPYHGVRGTGRHHVRVGGADVPGGPRGCGRPRGVSVCAARRGRRALPWGSYYGPTPCARGRGRRPRRPARLMASPWRPRVRGAPRTSRPTMGCVVRAGIMCAWEGPTSPAARAPDGVPDGVSMCAARRGRRALPWGAYYGPTPWVCGRGRRPRRPAWLMASPRAFPCTRRAEDVAPYHGVRTTGRHHVMPW